MLLFILIWQWSAFIHWLRKKIEKRTFLHLMSCLPNLHETYANFFLSLERVRQAVSRILPSPCAKLTVSFIIHRQILEWYQFFSSIGRKSDEHSFINFKFLKKYYSKDKSLFHLSFGKIFLVPFTHSDFTTLLMGKNSLWVARWALHFIKKLSVCCIRQGIAKYRGWQELHLITYN